MSAEIPKSGWLCTGGKQDQAKRIGNICSFLSLGQGRPPKAKRKSKKAEKPVLDLQEDSKLLKNKKNIRTTYLKYNNTKTKAALDRTVTAKLRVDANKTETDLTGG